MKVGKYIKDKSFSIILRSILLVLIIVLMLLFQVPYALPVMVVVLFVVTELTVFFIYYLKRKKFYDTLRFNLERLDPKYLVLETIEEPTFYEGQLWYQYLYEINKSMCENVKEFQMSMEEFKDYIEMWVHEVKLPIASLLLMCHNHKDNMDEKYAEQLRKLDSYTEQVLYFVRSEHAEKDFLIKEVELSKLITKVALTHKDDLLNYNVAFQVEGLDKVVLTDGKWLEFILNQIINNAIKYRDTDKEASICITAKEFADKTVLYIKDNGIGVSESDLGRVFEKSFTGENGRQRAKSTGMGLYIAKKLCAKMGHILKIESKKGLYTSVSIIFAKNDYYKM